MKRAGESFKKARAHHRAVMRRNANAEAAHSKSIADYNKKAEEHRMWIRRARSSQKETATLEGKVAKAEKALKECKAKPAKKDPWDFDWGDGFDFNWA